MRMEITLTNGVQVNAEVENLEKVFIGTGMEVRWSKVSKHGVPTLFYMNLDQVSTIVTYGDPPSGPPKPAA